MVYETRKAAAAACIYEANAAKHYSKVAIEYAQRGGSEADPEGRAQGGRIPQYHDGCHRSIRRTDP